MSRPSKPFAVLTGEKKSHRTKAELKQRQQGEEALASGVALKERLDVRDNPTAHKEFIRINKLLKCIEKNDALYEPIINRYCELQAEIVELKEVRKDFKLMLKEIRETFKALIREIDATERAMLLIDLTKELVKIINSIDKIDGSIQAKRKMLFDIEKENIFTIAAALRSIPKKEEKSSNKLLAALNGS